MTPSAWGVIVGLGVAMALQPLPPLAAIVLLSVQRGIRKAWAFFLGELVVMVGIGAATVALQLGTSRSSASRPMSLITLVAGLVLMLLGAWVAVRSRRASTPRSRPGWHGSTTWSPGRRSCSECSCRPI